MMSCVRFGRRRVLRLINRGKEILKVCRIISRDKYTDISCYWTQELTRVPKEFVLFLWSSTAGEARHMHRTG